MKALRQAIRQIILEAAVASTQAAGQGLALYRKGTGVSVGYVLYNPAALATELPAYGEGGGDITKVIYGYLDVKPHKGDCWNAGEIKFSAAQKGYGPLMYELAMSDFENGLFPDRLSTSDAARNVWKKYAQRSDVAKKPFDDAKNPKTPPKADDCKMIPDFDGEEAYLNQAYMGHGDRGGKAQMMQQHKDTVATIADQQQRPATEVEQLLWSMADEYFGMRYRDG